MADSTAILVLGMHRSGTSAVTRVLNLLGVDLGARLKPAADDNPSGFWEHESVIAIHDALLASMGMSWDDPRPLPDGWFGQPAARDAVEAIAALIRREFSGKALWAVKDPRLCRFVPVWREALAQIGTEPRALIVTRDPREVAQSLHKRNGIPDAVGRMLWARYMEDAEAGTRGLPRCLIDYEALLDDWRATTTRAARELDLALEVSAPAAAQVDAFLSDTLRHHLHAADPVSGFVAAMSTAVSETRSSEPALSRMADAARSLQAELQPYQPVIDGLSAMLAAEREQLARTEADAARIARSLQESTQWGASRDAELAQLVKQTHALQAELAKSTEWGASRDAELAQLVEHTHALQAELAKSTEWGASRDAELTELVERAHALQAELGQSTAWGISREAELSKSIEWARSREAELADVSQQVHALQAELAQATALGASRSEELRENTEVLERVRSEREQLQRELERQQELMQQLGERMTGDIDQLRVEFARESLAAGEALQRKQHEVEGLQHQANLLAARLAALEHRIHVAGFFNAARRLSWRALGAARRGIKRAIIAAAWRWPGTAAEKHARLARLHALNEARISGVNSRSTLADLQALAIDRWPARPAYRLRGEAAPPADVDLSIVVHHSERWVADFMASLQDLDYPLERIHLYVRDHSGDGGTRAAFERYLSEHGNPLGGYVFTSGRNAGYGAGHNHNFRLGQSSLFLVCNVDGRFRRDALRTVVQAAHGSGESVAAWELRQAPYEHPKYYDPITLLTTWVSGACVMFRRAAYRDVGGFDDRIFMYGEDVDLSYRLRGRGMGLAYVPAAVFEHDSYSEPQQFKPLQFHGSSLANILLRLRFGTLADLLPIAGMWRELGRSARQQGAYRGYLRNSAKLLLLAPVFLATRFRRGSVRIPFLRWDYGLRREGAFEIAGRTPPAEQPLVSIVVRTYRGRGELLRQALASVANQTYPRLEVVVVEDKGSELRQVAESSAREFGLDLVYIACESADSNRCTTGNAGLAAARGTYANFLDDDDLLFADHVEYLVSQLADAPRLGACYALAWETKVVPDPAHPGRYIEVMHSSLPGHRRAFDRSLLEQFNYIPIQAVLFRRDLFERYGGFDPRLDNLEDWELWRRYSLVDDFRCCPKTTSLYHVPFDEVLQAARQARLDEYFPIADRLARDARDRLQLASER